MRSIGNPLETDDAPSCDLHITFKAGRPRPLSISSLRPSRQSSGSNDVAAIEPIESLARSAPSVPHPVFDSDPYENPASFHRAWEYDENLGRIRVVVTGADGVDGGSNRRARAVNAVIWETQTMHHAFMYALILVAAARIPVSRMPPCLGGSGRVRGAQGEGGPRGRGQVRLALWCEAHGLAPNGPSISRLPCSSNRAISCARADGPGRAQREVAPA